MPTKLTFTAGANTDEVDVLYTDTPSATPDTVLETVPITAGAQEYELGDNATPGRRWAVKPRNTTADPDVDGSLSNVVEEEGEGGDPPEPDGNFLQEATGFTESATTTPVATLPVAATEGNLLFAAFSVKGAPAVTTPDGWTQVGLISRSIYVTLAVYAKRAAGGETQCAPTLDAAQLTTSYIAEITGVDDVTVKEFIANASTSDQIASSLTQPAAPSLGIAVAAVQRWTTTSRPFTETRTPVLRESVPDISMAHGDLPSGIPGLGVAWLDWQSFGASGQFYYSFVLSNDAEDQLAGAMMAFPYST